MTVTVTTPTKTEHPADGSDRWSVTGEAGRVVYDVLGNHLALIPTIGEIDSVMGRTLARVTEYAQLGDDDAVFAILADLYRTEMAGQARCIRCSTKDAAGGVCCSSHGKKLCHLCYRRTHWVEVCIAGCSDCAAENLPVKLSDLATLAGGTR